MSNNLFKPLAIALLAAACGSAALATTAAPGAGAAYSDSLQDYSYALPLSVSGKESIVQLRIPRDVYLHARKASLHDLRLFDGQGNKLPFALQAPQPRDQRSRRDLPVRLFAVQATRAADGAADSAADSAANGAADANITVRRSRDGAVLSVTTRARSPGAASAAGAFDTLILDLGAAAASARVDALRFSLPAGMRSYSARLVLEVSDDFTQWETVGESDIAWMANQRGETLSNDRIGFEARAFRYARLRWRSGQPLLFAAISAEAPLSTALAPVLERLSIPPAPGRFAQDWVYPSAPAIPVERIGLELAEQNVVLPAQLGQYRELPDRHGGKQSAWRFEPLAAATFYQFTHAGQRRVSGDIAITPAHVAQWVLRADSTGPAPALRLSWSPATLVFLANGKPPYRLAFGRDDARPAVSPMARVAPGFSQADLGKLENAVAGPMQTLRPVAVDAPGAAQQAAAAAHYRTLALWAALLAGVAVLGYMAWRLIGQIKSR